MNDMQLMTDREVAEFLGVCRRTVWNMVDSNRMPQPIELSPKTKRFIRSEVQEAVMNAPRRREVA